MEEEHREFSFRAVGLSVARVLLRTIAGCNKAECSVCVSSFCRCYAIGRRDRRGSSPLGNAARACGFDSRRLHSLTLSWVANQMMSCEGCHFQATAFPLAPKIRDQPQWKRATSRRVQTGMKLYTMPRATGAWVFWRSNMHWRNNSEHPEEGTLCLCEHLDGDYDALKAGCSGWFDLDFGAYSDKEITKWCPLDEIAEELNRLEQ